MCEEQSNRGSRLISRPPPLGATDACKQPKRPPTDGMKGTRQRPEKAAENGKIKPLAQIPKWAGLFYQLCRF
jgi:hypothetical protein